MHGEGAGLIHRVTGGLQSSRWGRPAGRRRPAARRRAGVDDSPVDTFTANNQRCSPWERAGALRISKCVQFSGKKKNVSYFTEKPRGPWGPPGRLGHSPRERACQRRRSAVTALLPSPLGGVCRAGAPQPPVPAVLANIHGYTSESNKSRRQRGTSSYQFTISDLFILGVRFPF